MAALTQVSDSHNLNLVRSVFGEFQKAAVKGGVHVSQNLVLFSDPHGAVGSFDFASDAQRAMSRQQGVAIHSHVAASRSALQEIIGRPGCQHAIVARCL